MKKIMLPLAAFALFATSCSSGPSDSDRKKNFVNVCVTSAQKDFGSTVNNDHIEDYCECSFEKLTGSMTDAELTELDKNPNDPVLNAKAEQITKPCLDDFVQKSSL